MIRLFRFLWTGSWHEHTWVDIEKSNLKGQEGQMIGFTILKRCSVCGKHSNYTYKNTG